MIRRVQRWGAEPWFPEFVGVGKLSLHYTKPFILEYDDGEPEMLKTEDRVVEGVVGASGIPSTWVSNEDLGDTGRMSEWIPATLTIHEPVKEPTLLEAVERYLRAPTSMYSAIETLDARVEMRAAVEREKKGKE